MSQMKLDHLSQVVAIGGGHGLGRLLSSISYLGPRLTGIVTTTDNGGSTGRLRSQANCIAWGDLRNCLNQLCTQDNAGSRMFEYRFENEGDLSGHNLGNLMLLAMDRMSIRPLEAVEAIRSSLQINTNLIPMTETPADLRAITPEGGMIFGEVSVDTMTDFPQKLSLSPEVFATREACDAIEMADLIILGPGSFLTSIMPPLLLEGIRQALFRTQAQIIYVANLLPEEGPAGQRNLQQQLHWCENQVGFRFIDAVLVGKNVEYQGIHPCYRADLWDPENPGFHNRQQLALALDHVLDMSTHSVLKAALA